MFLIKKLYMKVQKCLLNYTYSSYTNFNEKYPNTLKCPNTPHLYSNPLSSLSGSTSFEYVDFTSKTTQSSIHHSKIFF